MQQSGHNYTGHLQRVAFATVQVYRPQRCLGVDGSQLYWQLCKHATSRWAGCRAGGRGGGDGGRWLRRRRQASEEAQEETAPDEVCLRGGDGAGAPFLDVQSPRDARCELDSDRVCCVHVLAGDRG